MRRVLKWLLGTLLLLSGALLLAAWFFYGRDYAGFFQERRGRLASVSVEPAGGDSLSSRFWVTLKSSSGLQVVSGMLVPGRTPQESGTARAAARHPVIILLGGKATGKYAVDYALDVEGVIVVAPDYPYQPRSSYTFLQVAGDLPAIRSAIIDMMPSVMLLTDYLWSRSDVDTSRIILMGYSFGAPFVPCIVAHDRRAAAAVMVYGGGDVGSLIRHNIARYYDPLLAGIGGRVSAVLLHPVEPLRYVGLISPIPLLMVNGTDDEQVPQENAELLFAGAGEPKRIVWLESRHVNPRNPELTRRIVGTLKRELSAMKILPGAADAR